MTDKEEIIIDGVDVSECEYVCNTAFGNIGCKLPFNEEIHCCNISNCYYKQLVRKTQECEKKDKEINDLHLIIDRLLEASGYDKNTSTAEDFEDVYADIGYKLGLLDDLKKECDTLKSQLDFEVQQKECIEQECEELKEELAIYKKMLDDHEFKIALTDVRTGEREVWRKLGSKTDRYRKALEEIEEELKEDIYCESQECGCA